MYELGIFLLKIKFATKRYREQNLYNKLGAELGIIRESDSKYSLSKSVAMIPDDDSDSEGDRGRELFEWQ